MSERSLILGSEARIVLSIARSLGRNGIATDVATLQPTAQAPRSRWLGETVALAAAGDDVDAVASALTTTVAARDIDHLVVTSDSGLCLIDRCHAQLPAAARRSVPTPAVIAAVLDKAATAHHARRAGLNVPADWSVPTRADLAAVAGALQFPLVAKPADKRVSEPFKVRYFADLDALQAAFATDPAFGTNLLFQAFVPGEGVGVEILMHAGEPVCAFQHRRLQELPWSGGISVVALSEAVDPHLFEQSVELLRALGGDGLCMVEYRRPPDGGEALFMEVNARAYGSLSLAERCGMVFPWYHWQLLHARTPDPPLSYPVDVRWRWTAGVLLRASGHSRPGPPGVAPPSALRAWGDVLAACRPGTRDALWPLTDPLPWLRETGHTVNTIARRGVRGALRRLLPAPLVRRLQAWRDQPPAMRAWSRRRRRARLLGHRLPALEQDPVRIGRVLFVCHGNIFRSPMCEYLLRRALAQRNAGDCTVVSAGLHAHDGAPAHAAAIPAAAAIGIDLSPHRAQMVTAPLLAEVDLVVVMDRINERELLTRHPAAAARTVIIGDIARGHGGLAVADPYGRDSAAVQRCYADLAARIPRLCDWLRPSVAEGPATTALNVEPVRNAHPR